MGGVTKNFTLYYKRVNLMVNFLPTKLRMRPGLGEGKKSENNRSHCLVIINNSNMKQLKLNPLTRVDNFHR